MIYFYFFRRIKIIENPLSDSELQMMGKDVNEFLIEKFEVKYDISIFKGVATVKI